MARAFIIVIFAAFVAGPALRPAHPRPPSGKGTESRRRPAAPKLDPTLVNAPATGECVTRRARREVILRAQILLDRVHFSSGEIDGVYGSNLERALAAFQRPKSLQGDGNTCESTWQLLERDSAPALVPYRIMQEDIAGPFHKVPEDMMAKGELEALGYESPLEGIAEKFHASPALLSALNPGSSFDRLSDLILVPNIETAPTVKASSIVVSASDRSVSALDSAGAALSYYPASSGTERDPLPIGSWKVQGIRWNPEFFYNPKLFWDADPGHSKARIAPGPNSPVGVVWIDLSKQHLGIHGTPVPSTIGKTQSHGCIRLTNWDAQELARMVGPGTPAVVKP